MRVFLEVRKAGLRGSKEQSGITIVLVALSLVVLIGAAAIAIDLGTGYSSSRTVQNASDDAALAATRVLECYDVVTNTASPLYNPSAASQYDCPTGGSAYTADQVASTAVQVAQNDNGASAANFQCSVISYYGYIATPPYYQVLAPCSPSSGWTSSTIADGVLVSSFSSQATGFGKAVGTPSVSETRVAAATVQSFANPGPASSVIMVCAGTTQGTAQVDETTGTMVPPLVTYDPTTKQYQLNDTEATTVLPDGEYNGPVYNPNFSPSDGSGYGQPALELHGPGVDTCGLQGSGWHGIGDVTNPLPAWEQITTGDTASTVRTSIDGAPGCSGSDLSQDPSGCVLLLPICTDSNGGPGHNGQLYCVAWGNFELLDPSVHGGSGNEQLLGFLGTATVSSGQTGSGPPNGNNVNVVQLVQ